jgi:ribosomal protein S18 acetylase RimI-like enzyme
MHLRPLLAEHQPWLWDFLHVALWDPPPAPPRPRELLQAPQVRIYAEEWGRRAGDVGVLAQTASGEPMGACWMRCVDGGLGLAHVDADTPQLGIALLPAHQHRGFGEPLMRAALSAAAAYGHAQVSLTVHPLNHGALALYQRCGFVVIGERNGYQLMLVSL